MRKGLPPLCVLLSLLFLAGCGPQGGAAPSANAATPTLAATQPPLPTATATPFPLPTAPVPQCPQLPAAPAGTPPAAPASLYLSDGATLTALNASDGSKRWHASAGTANDPITSLAVAGDVIYLATEDGTVSALNAASGALRWCAKTRQVARTTSANIAPLLAVAQGVVYVTEHGQINTVTALDASTGSQRWQVTVSNADFYLFISLNVDAGLVGVATQELKTVNGTVTPGSTLTALNASDGSTRWNIQSTSGLLYDAVTLANGVVYAVELGESVCPDSFLDAVNASDGRRLWRAPDQNGCGWGAPEVAAGLVYVVDGGQGGSQRVAAFDAATGAQRWSAALIPLIGSQVVLDSGVVYVGLVSFSDGSGHVRALDARSGAVLWNWPSSGGASALFQTTPRSSGTGINLLGASNGKLYVALGTKLVALSSAGKQLWQASNLVVPGTQAVVG